MSQSKWYVVWVGRETGVFSTWTQCQAQVHGHVGAKYKSFKSRAEAQAAYTSGPPGPRKKNAGPRKAAASPRKAAASPPKTAASPRKTAPRAGSSSGPATGRPGLSPRPRYADHHSALADGRTVVYSDGGCEPNPGPGGFGVVLLKPDGSRQETAGGFRDTTNNRMELMGWIRGLSLTDPGDQVAVFSDSKYVGDMYAKGYAHGWRDRGWKTSGKKPAANADLWQQLLKLIDERDVVFTHVYGHTGVEENERCDELTHQARFHDPQIDEAYEAGRTAGIDGAGDGGAGGGGLFP